MHANQPITEEDLKKLQREIEETRRRIQQLRTIANDPEYLKIPSIQVTDPVPALLVSHDLKILEVNPSFLALTGYSPLQVSIGSDARIYLSKQAQSLIPTDGRLDTLEPFETEIRTRDGAIKQVITGFLSLGPTDKDWMMFFVDISERKKLQRQLAIKEANLRALSEAMPHLIWVADTKGNIIQANGALLDYLGIDSVDDSKYQWLDFVADSDKQYFSATGFSVGDLYADFQLEIRLRGQDGHYRWYLLRVIPFFSSNQASMSWLVISTDVDDQRKVTEALLQSEEQLRLIADAMPQIVWTANADGTIDFWNHRWFEYSGLTIQQSLHKGWRLLIHSEDLPRYDEAWRKAVAKGEVMKISFRLKRALGLGRRRRISSTNLKAPSGPAQDYLTHLCRAVPVKGQNGQVLRWFGTWTEIDEHKKTF